jgi:hypothetical protein
MDPVRKTICIANLSFAALAALVSLVSLPGVKSSFDLLPTVACIFWTIFAWRLLKAQRLWSWIGSILVVLVISVIYCVGIIDLIETFRDMDPAGPHNLGDRSTFGSPIFILGVLAIGSLLLLIALLSLPAWSRVKK